MDGEQNFIAFKSASPPPCEVSRYRRNSFGGGRGFWGQCHRSSVLWNTFGQCYPQHLVLWLMTSCSTFHNQTCWVCSRCQEVSTPGLLIASSPSPHSGPNSDVPPQRGRSSLTTRPHPSPSQSTIIVEMCEVMCLLHFHHLFLLLEWKFISPACCCIPGI